MFRPRREPRFSVLLIRPSKYDDDGYIIRYLKGVLPSNTLAALASLTRQSFSSDRFAGITTDFKIIDDTVEEIDERRLARRYLGVGRRAVVALAGVQTNQFVRATDLAHRFKAAGFEVMIGGFHVSGAIAMSATIPPECQALMDAGVTVVKGEVEDVWTDLLEDAWLGRLKPFYDILAKPDITDAPIPMTNLDYQSLFCYKYMGTIDTSRGCPFGCTFCTIINVQGRKMRCRSAESVARQIEENYRRHKVDYYFFTDDNFARNRNWEAVLDALIDLRANHNVNVMFMMQVDTKAWRLPRFVEKAAQAGCTQVFLGIESLNQANLESVGKTQNSVAELSDMIAGWHAAGVACHAGYIIGFPNDTPESVALDVEQLKTIGLDQCSFFMLTPLPGSADHTSMRDSGVWMDPDYNNYDSYHETLKLPGFPEGQWLASCVDAWRSFYSFDNMLTTLKRCNSRTYWGMFKNFMWYRSALIDGIHPMVSGLFRLRPRADRRSGIVPEGRLRHAWRRTWEIAHTMRQWSALFFELQELWLRTRIRSEREVAAAEYLKSIRARVGENVDRLSESMNSRAEAIGVRATEARQAIGERADGARQALGERGERARQWAQSGAVALGERAARAREWVSAGARAQYDYIHMVSALRRASLSLKLSRLLLRWNLFSRGRFMPTRAPLDHYWRQLAGWARQGRVFRLFVEAPRMSLNFFRDLRLSVVFFLFFLNELTND